MADFIGGVLLKLSDAASPEVYTAVNGLLSLSGFGKTNPLIDVTDFDSTAREYIAGLPDGTEITAEFNEDISTDSPATNLQLLALIAGVDNTTNLNMQITVTYSTSSPNITDTYSFAVVPLSWVINPSFEDKNTISFTLKITGAITKT